MSDVPELRDAYDILIVGGRPAGSGLAARLGERGVDTLVIDRARFPSLPAVPSCALLYPPTMALVDELGIDQYAFGDDSAKMRRFVVHMDGRFEAELNMFMTSGRDYVFGIDRDRFDHALWRNLARYESVTTCEGTSFRDVLRDDSGHVKGAQLKLPDGSMRSIQARCVVGADGRFSPVANKTGAKMRESFEQTSTAHFAAWEGVLPDKAGVPSSAHAYTTARGVDVLFFPAPNDRTYICTHVRSDRARIDSVGEYYQRMVDTFPEVRRRIAGATRVTEVLGLKRVANGYREAAGPGWVLVGDAFHHKDPIDGQGVYDALMGSKMLSEELVRWLDGEQSWSAATDRYDRRFTEETYPMFESTTQRLARELYSEPPELVMETVMRWMMTDPEWRHTFMAYLCRAVPPGQLTDRSLLLRATLRGALRALRRRLPGASSARV